MAQLKFVLRHHAGLTDAHKVKSSDLADHVQLAVSGQGHLSGTNAACLVPFHGILKRSPQWKSAPSSLYSKLSCGRSLGAHQENQKRY